MDTPSHYMDTSPPSEDTLFAQAEWVQGVVRAMVRDEHLAQDIAQDAMEAGLHAGTKKIRDPRAWLVGVVRNLHRQDARTGVRRRKVEQRKLEKVEEPSSEELLARLEVQQIVAKAVMELPDPFRAVLILRFYEGAPIRTVAVRRGIDRTKAESQVRRGLTLLHRRLKGRLGNAWAVAVLPLALPATASAMTATVAGLAGAASAKVLFSVAATALVCLGFGLWGFHGDAKGQGSNKESWGTVVASATPEFPTAKAEPVAGALPANPLERSALVPTPGAKGEWILRGLLSEKGSPAVHANVVLEIHAGHDNTAPLLHEIPLESDSHGRIQWGGDTPTGPIFVQLRSANPERHPSRSRGVLVVPNAPAPQDLNLQFYSWSREIIGVVRDFQGDPIAGALVRTADQIGETDEDGNFHLLAGPFSGSDFVYAQAPGFAELVELAYFKGSVAEVELLLSEEVFVRGRVVDQHGLPIPGAEVSKIMSRWHSVFADNNGDFALGNLMAGDDGLDIYAKKAGYAGARVSLGSLSAGTETRIEIVMTRGGIIQGHVRDQIGLAVAAAKLTLSNSLQGGPSSVVYSAENGFFRAESVLPGQVHVKVERPGFASSYQVVELDAVEGQLLELPIQLLAGREVEISILDTQGFPLKGGWAAALPSDDAPRSKSARSDASGSAVLSDMPTKEVLLEIGRPGFGKVVVPLQPDVNQLEVRLAPIPVLRGVVLDAETGEPVPNFRIQLTHVDTDDAEQGVGGISMELLGGREFQSQNGEWEIRYDLEPQHWLGFYVIAEGYTLHKNLRVQMPSGGDAISFVSKLNRGATLSGTVMPRHGGAPIAGAQLTWVDHNSNPSDLQLSTRNPSVTSDEFGRFELGGIPFGNASLIVEHKSWARHLEGPIALSSSSPEKEIRILLEKAATLQGIVLAADGTPMENVRITAAPEGMSALRLDLMGSTNAKGRFQIENLPLASYQIHAEIQSHGIWRTLYLTRGQDIGWSGLDLTIRRKGTARIHGQIKISDYRPNAIPVRAVQLSGEGTGDEFGGVAIKGTFEINNLPAGMYRVEIIPSDGNQEQAVRAEPVTVEVLGNGLVSVVLELTTA